MDIDKILNALHRKGLEEASHVTRFYAYRDTPERAFRLTIEITDSGPSVTPIHLRYSCKVLAENGELLVTGNPNSEVESAIEFVHWNNLDARLAEWSERNPET